ncbi:hypothetical protein [Arcticibacter sp.]|uniref:hypothetical protein n=1 Tax=Arcticibacter sp. TaxID=1872630 RepID=UPI00388F6F81
MKLLVRHADPIRRLVPYGHIRVFAAFAGYRFLVSLPPAGSQPVGIATLQPHCSHVVATFLPEKVATTWDDRGYSAVAPTSSPLAAPWVPTSYLNDAFAQSAPKQEGVVS